MNVNVLTPTAVLPSPIITSSQAVLQQSSVDVQPLNIVPVNVITQSSEVIPSNSACENIHQISADDIVLQHSGGPSSLLDQYQVRTSL